MMSVTLKIDGMSCDHCVRAVRQALEDLPQVDIQSVEIGRASLRYDNDSTDVERILAAIQEAGYGAETSVTGAGEAPDA
jgi:copper chaperone CopZ